MRRISDGGMQVVVGMVRSLVVIINIAPYVYIYHI